MWLHLPVGAAYVGLVSHLHVATGVQEAGGQEAAWTVVLEAAGENPFSGGGQRGDNGVASESRVLLSVPGKDELAAAVQHLAWLGSETHSPDGLLRAPDHGLFSNCVAGSRESRTSFVTVFRSTTKYRRQPVPWNHFSVVHPAGLSTV